MTRNHRPGARALRTALIVACWLVPAGGSRAQNVKANVAARDDAASRFEAAKRSPPRLRAFLYAMPKGGDLHNHLSGAVYAEALIAAGARDGRCVDPVTSKVTPCGPATRALADARTDAAFNSQLIDAWSMNDFVATSGDSEHDHFFAAFAKFSGVASLGDMAADVVNRAGRERMRYVELMVTFGGDDVAGLARSLPWSDDMAQDRARLLAAGLQALVNKAATQVAATEAAMRATMGCGSPGAGPGCAVTVRWLQQVRRTETPRVVFAYTLFAALLSQAAPDVVGLDFVAPEDNPIALADYTPQMRMLDYLHVVMPGMNVALHAGELTLGAVPPEALRFHIRQAVELGHARRIGHGVDIMYEADPEDLLREMAQKRVAVEINLTSNDQILGVRGVDHPFPIYLAAGVPTVVSTDDEGVERVDRTNELQRAVSEFGLDWPTLVGLERNSLEYAFIGGASLWADATAWRRVAACERVAAPRPTPACETFLRGSEKAKLQWDLESDLVAFDRSADP